MDHIVKDAMQHARMKCLELADKIEAPLPQRVKNIDTGELLDAYSLRLSSEERRLLVDVLRRAHGNRPADAPSVG